VAVYKNRAYVTVAHSDNRTVILDVAIGWHQAIEYVLFANGKVILATHDKILARNSFREALQKEIDKGSDS
jgi:hypothetical protein